MKKITPTVLKRSGWHQTLAICLAISMTILVVLQLFSFEDMSDELSVLLPASWAQSSIVVATLLVIGEVLMVAYFLPLALSPLARWCTRVIACLVPLSWIIAMAYALINQQAANVVYLGTKFDIHLTWGYVLAMGAFLVAIVTVIVVDLCKS